MRFRKLLSALTLGMGLHVLATVLISSTVDAASPGDKVTLVHVPNGGIQPQTVIDGKGTVHLTYFAGDPKAGDVYYVRSEDGERFSSPLRVNSQPGSVIAIGTIRGAHLALGKNGRAHVSWMGADKAEPRGLQNSAPMLYARLNDAGTAFEAQRNVIQKAPGLDGGGSVAADATGNVYVVWHAPEPDTRGEDNRCVWIARSTDEGKTFAPEIRANPDPTGACGCCGMRAFAGEKGALLLFYRSASEVVHRDAHLLISTNQGTTFRGEKIHDWTVGACPMSSWAFANTRNGTVGTWETDGQVYFAHLGNGGEKSGAPIAAPGNGKGRKHSVVATNGAGETLLAWTEGIGWNHGGSLAWQVYDKNNNATPDHGKSAGVPTWSLVSAYARPDGRFTIVY